MKFLIIDPRREHAECIEAHDVRDAQLISGVGTEVDHGVVTRYRSGRGISIVVGEFSLFVPPEQQKYFALAGRLYGGPAVLYAFDHEGATIDFCLDDQQIELGTVLKSTIMWLPDRNAVEKAIERGEVLRPIMRANSKIIWEWPQPKPQHLFGG